MVGIAYGARIMPVRVLNAAGNGSAARVARGMRWAVDHGADVLNVSIELYDRADARPVSITSDRLLRAAVVYAARHGVVVVAAAGNSTSRTRPVAPARRRRGLRRRLDRARLPRRLLELRGRRRPRRARAAAPTPSCPATPTATRTATPGRNVLQVSFRRPRYGAFLVPRDQQGTTGLRGTSMAAPHVSRRRRGAPLGTDARRPPVAARGPAAARQDGARPGPARARPRLRGGAARRRRRRGRAARR